jgi:hypothetical protein
MDIDHMREIVAQCEFGAYEFKITVDGRGEIYLQGEYQEKDILTGQLDQQKTRRWFLSPEMTRSEIVQTVFKCAMTSMEHRTREWFCYRGKAVFGPHFDVEALWEICSQHRLDERQPKADLFSNLPEGAIEKFVEKLWDETINR